MANLIEYPKLDPLDPVLQICSALELLYGVQALDFGDSLHRGAPLIDPPTMSPEQAHARRWRQYECDKIQADIYRAQERRP